MVASVNSALCCMVSVIFPIVLCKDKKKFWEVYSSVVKNIRASQPFKGLEPLKGFFLRLQIFVDSDGFS
jgi:hypothetical protein